MSFPRHRGATIASLALFGQLAEGFKQELRARCDARSIPQIELEKGARNDDVVRPYRRQFGGTSGEVLAGVAQERATARRGVKRKGEADVSFDIQWTTVCVNHYYVS